MNRDYEVRAKPILERVQTAWRLANVNYMEGLLARIDVAEERADALEDRVEELNATIEIAKKAYPERYAAPQASPPTVLSKDIYIDPETKKAIEELVKQPLSGAGDLKGILFDAIKTAEESEKELKTLRATVETMKKHRGSGAPVGALAPNQCIITIPEWAESEVDNFAEHEGKTRGEWLSETVDNYLENFCTQKQEA